MNENSRYDRFCDWLIAAVGNLVGLLLGLMILYGLTEADIFLMVIKLVGGSLCVGGILIYLMFIVVCVKAWRKRR